PATPTFPGLFQADTLPRTDAVRLMEEIAAHQEAMANLETLCDTFGPRLTGSESLRKAQRWALARLQAAGGESVHEEPYAFGRPWTRGEDRARLLTQGGQRLEIAALGWTPSTGGPIQAEVTVEQADTLAQAEALRGKLEGRIVLQGHLPRLDEVPAVQRDAYRRLRAELRQERPLAILTPSEKEGDTMTMAGSPVEGEGLTHQPTAFIAKEHAALLTRLARRGEPIRMELQIGGATGAAPVDAYNLVAEIKGSEWPEQVVIVGGHMDAWDLGAGATDNGTGTVAAMEVLRAIKALGLRPRRTIRIVLFSGEEQGLLGSRAYVKAHSAELKDIQAVLVDDFGTGAIKGWTLQGREDLAPALAAAMAPASVIGCHELFFGGLPESSDDWPFAKAGVPAFFAYQAFADYLTTTHHSQLDTFDHVDRAGLVQGAQAMAVTAWGLANAPERLAHRPAGRP
ncbi:MAG TPA: M20/M25/M40 family metallo-hydrolase, partial [Holophagaceae bacterium]|nr:M20/M25/M40 family metallo-hydrolase [Holophagaceae bacterium]